MSDVKKCQFFIIVYCYYTVLYTIWQKISEFLKFCNLLHDNLAEANNRKI